MMSEGNGKSPRFGTLLSMGREPQIYHHLSFKMKMHLQMNIDLNSESPEDIEYVIQLYFHRMAMKVQRWVRMEAARRLYRLKVGARRVMLGVGQLLLLDRSKVATPEKQEGIRFRWVSYFELSSHRLCFLVKSYYRGSSWNALRLPVTEFAEVKTRSMAGMQLFLNPLGRDYLKTIRKKGSSRTD